MQRYNVGTTKTAALRLESHCEQCRRRDDDLQHPLIGKTSTTRHAGTGSAAARGPDCNADPRSRQRQDGLASTIRLPTSQSATRSTRYPQQRGPDSHSLRIGPHHLFQAAALDPILAWVEKDRGSLCPVQRNSTPRTRREQFAGLADGALLPTPRRILVRRRWS